MYYNGVWGSVCDDGLYDNNNRNGDRLAQVLCRMMWYIRGGDYQPDGTKDSSYETSEILLDDVSFSLIISCFFGYQIEKEILILFGYDGFMVF